MLKHKTQFEVMDMSLLFTDVRMDYHSNAIVTIDNEKLSKYVMPNMQAITEALQKGLKVGGIKIK